LLVGEEHQQGREWAASKDSGAWRQDMDKTAFWTIFEKP
jgi:hypothetical protein